MAENVWLEKSPEEILRQIASNHQVDVFSKTFAVLLDEQDEIGHFRNEFVFPKKKLLTNVDTLSDPDSDCLYLCGNSLGLRPKRSKEYIDKVFENWDSFGVQMHFQGFFAALYCDEYLKPYLAELVGAEEDEVTAMNGLTVNLHLLCMTFYKPTATRHKILIEDNAFPSDRWAMQSLLKFHGYDPHEDLIEIKPRQDEDIIRDDDIIKLIETRGHEISLILFSGVHFYNGQLFDMESITRVGHTMGCVVGLDLAHAIGNVKLDLHKWNVDFAAWCSYKYLNSGAGGIAGIFVHRNRFDVEPAMLGWFGNKASSRFAMDHDIEMSFGSDAYKISNPSPFLSCMAFASLEIFSEAGMDKILKKQFLLTGYLEFLLGHHFRTCNHIDKIVEGSEPMIKIVTPADHRKRGNQLSLSFSVPLTDVYQELKKRGVVIDMRKPNVLRVGLAPLYNTFQDAYNFTTVLMDAFTAVKDKHPNK